MRAFLLREGDRIRVITPYVPDFVTDLKAEIPYYAKDFDRDSKHWLIDGEYEDAVLEVTGRYFEPMFVVSEAESLRRERTARNTSAPPSSAHSARQCLGEVKRIWSEEAELYLLPDAPRAVIEAAFRAAAKLFHPDLVGSNGHARMVAINRAYDILKKRAGGAA